MKLIKVGTAALNQTPLDWKGNSDNIISAIEDAKAKNIKILCLPELCISGYGCEDAFLSPLTADFSLRQLEKIILHTKDIIVCLGMPLFIEGSLYNTSVLVVDGEIAGIACKQFLAGDGVHYEQRWFKPWSKQVVKEIDIFGRKVLAGALIFELGGIIVGIEICEDAWHVNRPARDFVSSGIDIILNPSASHFAFGKLETRKRIITESSRFCNSVYIYANLNGLEAGRIIYDGGGVIASGGNILLQGKRFSYKPYIVDSVTVDLDLNKVRKTKNLNTICQSDVKLEKVIKNFTFPEISFDNVSVTISKWETSSYLKHEEFTRSVGLGLYDYMRKSKSRGFVLSLSGGIDSGACAVLIFYMLKQMVHELGMEKVKKRFLSIFDNIRSFDDIYLNILTTVYQRSNNSTDNTYNAAKTLAGDLGFSFHNLDISNLVSEYTSLIEDTVKRKLDWELDDKALQNIQARVRGPSVWMLANIKRALLLTTSNRSEAAVGYATMDGDTCGGLCPLGGIDKVFLINWMRWIAISGPLDLGKINAVTLITEQKPTAELRPAKEEQTDENDLMPYERLDQIEKAFIRDRKSPIEIFKTLLAKDAIEEEKLILIEHIRKFLTLWQINQWKRERYAPSFHLDDESLDPKSSCRYPILSGDFQEELNDLRENVLSE